MRILSVLVFFLLSISAAGQQLLRAGMKIQSSLTIKKEEYHLNAEMELARPVIEITGDNIVVDFSHAVIKGSNDQIFPNKFYGLCILIRDGKNITIKNLNARGYKVAVMARNVEGLTIEHCDLSYNYRQHLNSTQEKEDISDWMSYHHNEKDEWLRYGAAIYLRNCNKATIHDNLVTGGQCALMMTDCNDGKIYCNNLSFNSGIGIGMYRSSNNHIFFNKLDFNVRGYSHGIYNRGQDSAGILVFEQCNNNVFYRNSVSHSGDGFFLWAGQTTMDSGKGGCNDNFIAENDFSFAPTNGVEVTFSSNIIYSNSIFECDNGIWGGYSHNTEIINNKFAYNKTAIAIEHGQNNKIAQNNFREDSIGISLWARNSQPADWGFAKYRNTDSKNYQLWSNKFDNVKLVFQVRKTDSVKVFENDFKDCGKIYTLDAASSFIDTTTSTNGYRYDAYHIDMNPSFLLDIDQPADLWLDEQYAERRNIRITEWGPYDFRYPLIWRTNPIDNSGLLKFDIIGPKGKWKLISSQGIKGVSRTFGSFPSTLTAFRINGSKEEILIDLECIGQKITDEFGKAHASNKPYRFRFRDSRIPIKWEVQWYGYDTTSNPIKDVDAWTRIISNKPIRQAENQVLDYAWWGGIKAGDRQMTRFATVATADVDALPGTYELSTTWDDAVRVYLDGRLIVDEWNPSLYTFDESPNKTVKLQLNGHHKLRVEHVELGGFATLNLKLRKL